MRRKVLLTLTIAAAIAVPLAVVWRGVITAAAQSPPEQNAAEEQIPAPAPSPISAAPAAERCTGVGSCASPACHGGPVSPKSNPSRSAYTAWVENDRHAQAFSELYSTKSREIIRKLDRLDAAATPAPYRDSRCLACHATGGAAAREGPAIAAEGVGCEACHGAAGGWLAEHTARDWNNRDGKMKKLRDLAVRAETCVGCHVGSQGADGLPLGNMDHDMIAAGHPRLTFEFNAFLANMPHHWDDDADRGALSAEEFAAKTWSVGQIASTRGALRLLAARARAADWQKSHAPWPELSDYDCYACHHRLSPDRARQDALARAGSSPEPGSVNPPRRLVHYVWGSWYLPTTRLLLSQDRFDASGVTFLDAVEQLMDSPVPQTADTAANAEAAAGAMQHRLNTADDGPNALYGRQPVDRMLLATKDQPAKNWDEACGQYLLFRAACSRDRRFSAPLLEVRELLRFDKPRGNDATEYNSPIDFDPVRFNHKMGELRALLPRQ
jgi:hypothetical protein